MPPSCTRCVRADVPETAVSGTASRARFHQQRGIHDGGTFWVAETWLSWDWAERNHCRETGAIERRATGRCRRHLLGAICRMLLADLAGANDRCGGRISYRDENRAHVRFGWNNVSHGGWKALVVCYPRRPCAHPNLAGDPFRSRVCSRRSIAGGHRMNYRNDLLRAYVYRTRVVLTCNVSGLVPFEGILKAHGLSAY